MKSTNLNKRHYTLDQAKIHLLIISRLPLRSHLQYLNTKRKKKKAEVTPEIKMRSKCPRPTTQDKIPSKTKKKKRSIKNMKCKTFLLKMRVLKIKTFKN
jgi:hypothetical protein